MSDVNELRLTSKRVKNETIKRIRIDIPDGSTEEEKEELYRELCIWYNFYNPTAAVSGNKTASEAIKEDEDEHGRFYWFNNGYNMHGNDLNKQVFHNVVDTEVLSKM